MSRHQQAEAFLKRTRARTIAVRDDEAAKLLTWEQVNAVIGAAAGKGQSRAVIVPPAGVDLRNTVLAVETAERLRLGGFAIEWQSRREAPEGAEYFALIVSW